MAIVALDILNSILSRGEFGETCGKPLQVSLLGVFFPRPSTQLDQNSRLLPLARVGLSLVSASIDNALNWKLTWDAELQREIERGKTARR